MTMIRITLNGQLPGGKNAVKVTQKGHRYPDKRFVAWREGAFLDIITCVPKPIVPIDKPCSITVYYTPGDLRRRDVPGMLDAIFHALERGGVVKDDALIQNVAWKCCKMDREHPKAEVGLEVW